MSISEVVRTSSGHSRITELFLSKKILMTPTYFPAISSYGVSYAVDDLADVLINYSYPRLLISAYDLYLMVPNTRHQLQRRLVEYSKAGRFVFLDSGVYESSWKKDSSWTAENYSEIVRQVRFDLYTSFDILPSGLERNSAALNLESIRHSRELSVEPGFIPIVHGARPPELVSAVNQLVKSHPDLCGVIAVPERDCGIDIIERAKTIAEIRKTLNSCSERIVLHVLGTGDPTSLALYAYCGADMFDSLDWIKAALDPQTMTTHAFSHLDLLGCRCRICAGKQRSYAERVFLHNLLFYQEFMMRIQDLIRADKILSFVESRLGREAVSKLAAAVGFSS